MASPSELLITLLRRGDETRARSPVQAPDFRIGGNQFHYWPALDFAAPEFGSEREGREHEIRQRKRAEQEGLEATAGQ
jgi:hypothetical protein